MWDTVIEDKIDDLEMLIRSKVKICSEFFRIVVEKTEKFR